jgi:hypothetical protein
MIIDTILDNLFEFAVLGMAGAFSALMLAGIALGILSGVLKACWKAARQMWRMAREVWRWLDGQLKTEPQAQAVSKLQAKPQPMSRDIEPLKGQPDWRTSEVAFTKTLPPTNPSTMPQTMPPIYYH